MPVLHAYKSGEGHYVKAWINGAIVTFQVTPSGLERLQSEGVDQDGKFPLNVLVNLIADGLVFTGAGDGTVKAGYHEAEQFVFGFDENSSAEQTLPVCEESGAFGDLHLVTHGDGQHTQLLAPDAMTLCQKVSLNVPLDLLSDAVLDRLLAAGRIVADAPCLEVLRAFFARSQNPAWVVHRDAETSRQTELELPEADGALPGLSAGT